MEFLVSIKVEVPQDFPASSFEQLLVKERVRGQELKAQGAIERIWRVPGTRNNVGIWKAEDASQLHLLLSSLPIFAFMTIEIVPLAVHPLEEEMK
jgi:muconolactone D-isomerase